MPATGPDFKPGEPLPGTKYRVVKQLGAGGMGVVYQVVKPPQIQGVMKLMSTDLTAHEEFRTRFLDEVRILAQIDHPNIVRVFDYDTLSDGTPYYVMEVLHGRTVRDVLATMGKVPPRVAYEITRQLLEALHCAHTHDVPVVHRDIKPENIFLHAPRHGEPVVKLIDFGVIAVADRKHDGSFVGTWKYAAPEQIRGEVATPATDLYAVGLVLYEMLSGVGPFDHVDSGELVSQAHLHEVPAPVSTFAPWVPASIVTLIQSALAKDPRVRPRDAYAFAERLFELEWATDGKDPHDLTAEGPAAVAVAAQKKREANGEVGPLSKVLSTVGAAGKPSSEKIKVGVLAVPAEGVHAGPTLRGVGNGPRHEPTSPDEDALLEGLGARGDAKPMPRKARESGRDLQADAAAENKVIIHATAGAPILQRRPPSAPTLDAPPSAPRLAVGATPSDVAITAPRVAVAAASAKVDTDTFASQESDARPAKKSRLPWMHVIAATALVLAVGTGLLVRHRLTTTTASTTPPPPPVVTPTVTPTVAPTETMTAPPATTTALITPEPPPTNHHSAPPTTKSSGRPSTKHSGTSTNAGTTTATTASTKPPSPASSKDPGYDRSGP